MSEYAYIYLHVDALEVIGSLGGIHPARLRHALGVENLLREDLPAGTGDRELVVASTEEAWDDGTRQLFGHRTRRVEGFLTRHDLGRLPYGDLIRVAVPLDLLPLTWADVAPTLHPDLAAAVEKAARRFWVADPARWRMSKVGIPIALIAHLETVYDVGPGDVPTWARLTHRW